MMYCLRQSKFLLVALAVIIGPEPLAASEFRDLLSFRSDSRTHEGNSSTGNNLSVGVTYTNASTTPFVINGVSDIQTRDPEDLGFNDIGPTFGGLSQLEASLPSYDLFNSSWFSSTIVPRKEWIETTVVFSESFPILVEPGDSFSYVRTSRNTSLGPNFSLEDNLSTDQTNAIGEVLVAIDFDWQVVPEPSSFLLLLLSTSTTAMWRRR